MGQKHPPKTKSIRATSIQWGRFIQSGIKPNTIGIPLPNVQARLANDQLIIKSPSTMLGYYNQPEETAKKIVNGWYYTDLPAIIDPEGYISLISCPSTEMEREEK
jgi:acyl-CoA synthetase (AMP-forming)/AMP-acid ligase II